MVIVAVELRALLEELEAGKRDKDGKKQDVALMPAIRRAIEKLETEPT